RPPPIRIENKSWRCTGRLAALSRQISSQIDHTPGPRPPTGRDRPRYPGEIPASHPQTSRNRVSACPNRNRPGPHPALLSEAGEKPVSAADLCDTLDLTGLCCRLGLAG